MQYKKGARENKAKSYECIRDSEKKNKTKEKETNKTSHTRQKNKKTKKQKKESLVNLTFKSLAITSILSP